MGIADVPTKPILLLSDFYHIKQAQFLLMPVQAPHIPIWVGGNWPNKRPFQRAARWDGVYPLFKEWEKELEQLPDVVAYIQARRESDRPFDIVLQGETPGDDKAKAAAIVAPYAEVGLTWWLEAIAPYRFGQGFDGKWPVEALRQRVLQGPPEI